MAPFAEGGGRLVRTFFLSEPRFQVPAGTERALRDITEIAVTAEALWLLKGHRRQFEMFRQQAMQAGVAPEIAEALADDSLERVSKHTEQIHSSCAARTGGGLRWLSLSSATNENAARLEPGRRIS